LLKKKAKIMAKTQQNHASVKPVQEGMLVGKEKLGFHLLESHGRQHYLIKGVVS
jgi:hypothetical protein